MAAIIILGVMALALGTLLGAAANMFRLEEDPAAEKINAILPQTQCGQCGYAGCKPYAEAIANNNEEINKCPPGGETVVNELAGLLGRDPKPLAGEEKEPAIAIIDENICIGCTLCIQACPVDAILGAAKHMHTVIAAECTGCELCLPPCPVECIRMELIQPDIYTWIPKVTG